MEPAAVARRCRPRLTVAALVAGDAVAVALCATVAVLIRWWLNPGLPVAGYLRAAPALAAFLLLYALLGLYGRISASPADELRRLTVATTLGALTFAAFAFLGGEARLWSRGVLVMAWLALLPVVPLARAAVRGLCSRRAWWGTPVLVLGAGATGQLLVRQLRRMPWLGLRPVGVLDDDPGKTGSEVVAVPVLGGLDRAAALAGELGIRHAVVAAPGMPTERMRELERAHRDVFPHLVIVPPLVGFAAADVRCHDLGGVLGIEVRRQLLMPGPRRAKRALDYGLVLFFLPLWLPLVLGLALLVKLTSPGPAFFGQRRLGEQGREFRAWKFRSMVRDAEAILKGYLEAHPELRAEWERDHKLKDDPRVTWMGRILRKTSLDELPQLFNVLLGEMSLVGPRPIVQAEVAKYADDFDLYVRVRPGITGLWQVSGRNDTTYGERVALDCHYVRNWSPWLDVVILARTVRAVLFGRGAY